MFAPVAAQNIDFPTRTSLSTLDFIPESFDAYRAYSAIPTASAYTTQSILTNINAIMRWGINDTGKILGIAEGGGVSFIWDTVTETSSSVASMNVGTIRNVVWDNLTNSWVICGSNSFMKVDCDTLATASIAVPTNSGSQYPAVVAYGGKAYAMPLVGVTSATRVAIFDLVANTSTTSSVTYGGNTVGFWGAVLNSIGTIYFFKETTAANASIYEYNPITDTGTLFGTIPANGGYGPTNLPNGNVFAPGLGINQSVAIINPVNKSIQTIATAGFGYATGICVGQNGQPYGIRSDTNAANNGIWGFNTATQTGYKTQYVVQQPSSGDRGFQDFFSLPDGRLVAMPGQNNSGRLVYYTFLSNPRSNTFSQVGAANPIIQTGKGT
jgi:hypothetical protein